MIICPSYHRFHVPDPVFINISTINLRRSGKRNRAGSAAVSPVTADKKEKSSKKCASTSLALEATVFSVFSLYPPLSFFLSLSLYLLSLYVHKHLTLSKRPFGP